MGYKNAVKRHCRIFFTASLVWGVFWLIGLPDYYQQYSFTFMLVFDLVLLLPLTLLVWFILKKERQNRKRLAVWLALYCTVPFLIYDLLYCGYYLEHGISFMNKYWYLSVYYFIPWILCLPLGRIMERSRQAASPDQA